MTNQRILCVDDEPKVLVGLRRMLSDEFQIETAEGPLAGLRRIVETGAFAVVLADFRMPDMNGIEFLERVKTRHPDTVRMMLTGDTDQGTATKAVNRGEIFRFLNKPADHDQLRNSLRAALEHFRLVQAEREILEETLSGSVEVLTDILAITDPQSFGRASSLRADAQALATRLGAENRWEIEVALRLSQLGRVAVPSELRRKHELGEPLSAAEEHVFQRVPVVGYDLLKRIPRMQGVAEIVRHQAARFDGADGEGGTPAGDAIPLGSRILRALADVADLEERGMERRRALAELRSRAGTYDPAVLDALVVCSSTGTPAEDELAPVRVVVEALRPGHVLAADLETADGRRILARGARISSVVLERIRNHARLATIREPVLIESPRDFGVEPSDAA